MSFINLYSAPIFLVLAAVLGAALIVRRGSRREEWAGLAGIILLAILAWLAFRPAQSNQGESTQITSLTQGKPALLEFQSPY